MLMLADVVTLFHNRMVCAPCSPPFFSFARKIATREKKGGWGFWGGEEGERGTDIKMNYARLPPIASGKRGGQKGGGVVIDHRSLAGKGGGNPRSGQPSQCEDMYMMNVDPPIHLSHPFRSCPQSVNLHTTEESPRSASEP